MTKMLAVAVALSSLLACGDNIQPLASTYGEALEVWGDPTCDDIQVCHPLEFQFFYGDHDGCIAAVLRTNCTPNGQFDCEMTFPPRQLETLADCRDAVDAQADCSFNLPQSCRVAFGVE
jgi:hypothetical protein